MKEWLPLLILVPALAACGARMAPDTSTDVPAVTVIGEPVRCINTSLITDSFVRSDRVIDFRMSGGPDYRNTLPGQCLALGFDRRFSYEPIAGQVCAGHTLRVLEQGGGATRSCAFGEFVPVEDVR